MNRATLGRSTDWDGWLAAACAGALGLAGVLALAGTLAGNVTFLLVAAALGAGGLGLLLAAGWLEALTLLLASLPLPALYATENARLAPVLPVAALVVAAWFVGYRGTGGTAHPRPVKAMAAIVAAAAVASLFAQVPLAAVREVVNFTLLLGILAVATDLVRRTPRRGVTVAKGLAVVAALAGGAAALEALGLLPGRFTLPGSTLARAAGGFGWPNELAMFLAIALPFPVFALRRAEGLSARVLALMGIGLVMLGLTSTFSRGSWVAVLVAPAALVFVGEGRVALRFWGGALLAVAVVDVLSGGAMSTRAASTTSDVLVAQRLLLMTAGLLMFRANPVVGVGPGGFGDALDEFGLQVSGLFDFVGSAHNGYIHMAAESGILGLTALLYFLISAFRGLSRGVRAAPRSGIADGEARDLRVACFWAFSTACLVMLFEWPFAHGVGELIVLVVGVGLALAPQRLGSP